MRLLSIHFVCPLSASCTCSKPASGSCISILSYPIPITSCLLPITFRSSSYPVAMKSLEDKRDAALLYRSTENLIAPSRSVLFFRYPSSAVPERCTKHAAVLFWRNVFLHLIAEEDHAHLIVVADGAECQNSRHFGDQFFSGGRWFQRGCWRLYHEQHHGQFLPFKTLERMTPAPFI